MIRFFYSLLIISAGVSGCGFSSGQTSAKNNSLSNTIENTNTVADISFASSNQRFTQSDKPFAQPVLQQQLIAWKNERVSCQVLIWAKTTLSAFKLNIDDNTADKAAWQNAIHFGVLKNVAANISGGMCGSVPKDLPEVDVADLISNDQTVNIETGKLQLLWITIHVPKSITEGMHTIYLTPQSKEHNDLPKLTLNININKNVLPDPALWKFHLDLWQYPLRVARYYNVKPWSPEHFQALKPTMQQLANAGQKAITASFFWDNMNNENYGFENLMVKVNRSSNGPLQFDFTNFDKWVEFMMSLGIKDQIDCFGMYPFTNNLSYYITDPALHKTATNSFVLASDDYKVFWTSFLKSFAQHLRAKGWMDKTVLYFDERPPKNVMNVVSFIKQVDAAFKIGYTGGYDATLTSALYDFSIPSYLRIPADALNKRNRNNLVTTFYTTCFEKKPNQFTYSSPAESSFMGWYAFANGYNGYLRWALNMWEKNSTTDTRSIIVPAGDKFIIYPESYSSVRFEKLIEGIQEYEKLTIIMTGLRTGNNKAAIKKINDLLNNFKIDNAKNITDYPALIENAERFLNTF